MDPSPFIMILAPLLLIATGVALLWIVSCQREWGTADGSKNLRRRLRLLGWFVFLLGLFVVVTIATGVFFILGWAVTAVVLATGFYRYYEGERQTLLWLLTASASRGIPLESAARAFARDRDDRIGRQATKLADYLEAGLPLALALKRSGHRLPDAAVLAAELGQHTGEFGTTLGEVAIQADAFDRHLRNALEKMFYLMFMVAFVVLVLTFLMLKIVPIFVHMLDEFDMELPAVTQALIWSSGFALGMWPLTLLLALLVCGVLFAATMQYVGWPLRLLPPLGRIWRRLDAALVMRWLAVAVQQGRPITEMMRLLAAYFPRARMRRRLEGALERVELGVSWCEGLRRAGVIRSSDVAVFKAAEKAGNLAWALEEVADTSIRRSAHWLRIAISVAFPIAIFALGGVAFFVFVGILAPLIDLIQGLT